MDRPEHRNRKYLAPPMAEGCIVPIAFLFLLLAGAVEGVSRELLRSPKGVAGVAAVLVLFGLGIRHVIIAHRYPKCVHGVRANENGHVMCDKCEELRRKDEKSDHARLLERRRRREEEERHQREESARVRELAYLGSMDPFRFERLIQEMFRRQGWQVEATPASNDRGVDAYLRMQGKSVVLQCKCFSGTPVGAPVLRDLLGTVHAERADGGIIVTTSRFTKEASKWRDALETPNLIVLIDGHQLVQLIRSAFPTDSPVPASFVNDSTHTTKVARRGRRGRRRH